MKAPAASKVHLPLWGHHIMTQKSPQYKLEDYADEKKLELGWLKEDWGLHDLGNGIGIPYFDEARNEMFVRIRNPPGVEPRFKQPKGVKLQPYGLNRLDAARRASRLYLCEGESDTLTLLWCGLPALGLPGAHTEKVLERDHVEGIADIYLMPDNDRQSAKFVEGVRRRLGELGYDGRLHLVHSMPSQYKDVSEWFVDTDRAENFLEQLENVVEDAELLNVETSTRASRKDLAGRLGFSVESSCQVSK
jgi:hypothetical protein